MTPKEIVRGLRSKAEDFVRSRDKFDLANHYHDWSRAFWQGEADLMNAAADYIEAVEKEAEIPG